MAFPSHGVTHRPTVTGTRGMVSSAHPLASLAGAWILLQGGNAFDATVFKTHRTEEVEKQLHDIYGVIDQVIMRLYLEVAHESGGSEKMVEEIPDELLHRFYN